MIKTFTRPTEDAVWSSSHAEAVDVQQSIAAIDASGLIGYQAISSVAPSASSAAIFSVVSFESLEVTITGIWTGGLVFEGSGDGSYFTRINGFGVNGIGTVAIATAPTLLRFNVATFSVFRVRAANGSVSDISAVICSIRTSSATAVISIVDGVEISSSVLPTGAATDATLAAIKAKTDNLDVLLSTRAITGLTNTELRAAPVIISGALTDAQLRASAVPISTVSLPLPTGASTEATLLLIKAKTDNLDVALSTRAVTGLTDMQLRATPVPVSGPLTDAQLRTSAVPVSASSLPLPTGAATETTLGLIQAKTNNLDVLLSTRTKPSDQQHAIIDNSALPTGASTETTLALIKAKTDNLDVALSTRAVTGLTDTQLRATPVPVSGTFFQTTQPVSGTFFQATQPISAIALPLPTGASTETTLALIKAKTDNIDVALSTRAVTGLTDTQLRASAVPVSGTFFQSTQPVSIAGSVAVTGTFFQATQPISGTVAVSNFPATQPVNGTITANIGTTNGLALDATLTGGTQKAIVRGGAKGATVAADVTSTVEGTDHQSLDIQIYHGGIAKDPTQIRALTSVDIITAAQATAANLLATATQGPGGASAWKVDGSAVIQPISAAALPLPTGASTEATLALIKVKTDNLDVALSTRAITGLTDTQLRASAVPVSNTQLPVALVGGRLDENIGAWLGSTTPTVGQKTMAASLPVVWASDQAAGPAQADRSGTGTITILNSGSPTVPTPGSTVSASTIGMSTVVFRTSGVFVATLGVEGSVDGITYTPITGTIIGVQAEFVVGYVSSQVFFAVPCGGFSKVRLSAVSYTSGTVTVDWNAGVGLLGTQVHSLDITSLKASIRGQDVVGTSFPTGLVASGTLVASVAGLSSLTVSLFSTWIATVVFEANIDGTLWFPVNAYTQGSGAVVASTTVNGNFTIPCGGFQQVRVRVSAFTSGPVQAVFNVGLGLNATPIFNPLASALQTQSQGPGVAGSALVGNPILTSGSDGANTRTFLTDTLGNQRTIGPSRTRISIIFQAVAPAVADTLLNLVKSTNGVAAAGATSQAVTNGKTFHISSMTCSLRAGAASAAFATFTLRINPAGTAVISSQSELRVDLGNTAAVVGAADKVTIPLDFELVGSGGAALAVSAASQAVTNILSVTISGYEF